MTNRRALIGHTGFVGSNLRGQMPFDGFFASANILELKNTAWDVVICAGIQAKKWWANQNPELDWSGITQLLDVLKTIRARHFVLISTVDVYPTPSGVDEETPVHEASNHAYGKHRFLAEEFVRERFDDHLILRLPGLFGTGIKKNVIHDLLNGHELEKLNPAGVYQYYYLDRLSADIEKARSLGLRLLNISAEPVATREIVDRFFPGTEIGPEAPFHCTYDMHSRHWREWASSAPGYLYEKKTVVDQLETFISHFHSV